MTAAATGTRRPQWTLDYQPKVTRDDENSQKRFHQDRYEVPYRALLAGTGSGKTFSAVAEDLYIALKHPDSVGLAGAPTFPMVRQALFPVFETHLDTPQRAWEDHPLVKTWNRSEYLLEFTNDSRIYFISLDKPERVEGITVNWVHLTEARLVKDFEEAWRTLNRRIRRDGYQAAWLDTHSPTKELVDLFTDTDQHRIYRWSIKDAYEAGVISERYYRAMVESHHGARAKAVLEGEYARPEGLVYDQFTPAEHLVPSPDPPIPERPDDYTPWAQATSYGVDWGYTHATCITVILWAGNTAHVVDEWWATHHTIQDYIEAAQDLREKWGDGIFWCGPDKPGHIDDFNSAGLDARPVPSDRRKVADGTEHVNDRFAGNELFVDPNRCPHFVEEVDMYAMDEEKDEPEKDAPDAVDSARYGIYSHASEQALYVEGA